MSCQSHSPYVCKLPCFYSAICMWGALVKINSLGSHWRYFEFFWETFFLFLYEWFNTDPIYESISQIWSRADAYLIVVNYPSLQQSLKTAGFSGTEPSDTLVFQASLSKCSLSFQHLSLRQLLKLIFFWQSSERWGEERHVTVSGVKRIKNDSPNVRRDCELSH